MAVSRRQLNRDNSTRDFVDYDANLIALAHGVPSPDRAKRLFSRIDAGRCSAKTGAGPQFVSEVYYGASLVLHALAMGADSRVDARP